MRAFQLVWWDSAVNEWRAVCVMQLVWPAEDLTKRVPPITFTRCRCSTVEPVTSAGLPLDSDEVTYFETYDGKWWVNITVHSVQSKRQIVISFRCRQFILSCLFLLCQNSAVGTSGESLAFRVLVLSTAGWLVSIRFTRPFRVMAKNLSHYVKWLKFKLSYFIISWNA